jgi:D-alanyl-D-alanine carboxypeptidase (penicillin-binding protein 5/6)
MAIIAKNLLEHQNVLKYSSKYEAYLRQNTDHKFWLVNTNKMIRTYQGVDGLKTGFTQKAKYCLTATAKKNGMRVIAVVMGAPTSKVRNAQVASLLNYAYSNYSVKTLIQPHTPIGKITVHKSAKKQVLVETNAPATLVLKKGEKLSHYTSTLQLDKNKKAPLKKGTKVGHYVIKKDNKIVRKVPVVLKETAPSATWWDYIRHTTDRMLSMT